MAEKSVKTVAPAADAAKLGKLKAWFLYILVGGLVVSAVISVVAILIGEFNSIVLKALLTTFIFVTHSLLVLAIILADKYNQIGKAIVSTTILAATIANMITATFGIWEIWRNDDSGRAFLVYMLFIGGAFIVSALLKLRLAHRVTDTLALLTVGLVVAMVLSLIPWIVLDADVLSGLYFRLVSAVTILAATSLTLTVIFNRIAVSHDAKLKARPARAPISGGQLAINITVGTFVAFFWMFGLVAFIASAVRSEAPDPVPYPQIEPAAPSKFVD